MQIIRADLILAELLSHIVIEDSLLFLSKHTILQLQLLLILLHRLCLLLLIGGETDR